MHTPLLSRSQHSQMLGMGTLFLSTIIRSIPLLPFSAISNHGSFLCNRVAYFLEQLKERTGHRRLRGAIAKVVEVASLFARR